ncbi:hypothetical protein F3644_21440 [Escherichia coli]|nr:hypothetical protein [Escherichia coli]EFN5391135.1 hypothetical protein [Escherichia coli]EFN5588914.1 hypothetical protein [Escherichia coli]
MRIQFCTVMPNESVEVMRPHFSQESVCVWGFYILQRCY